MIVADSTTRRRADVAERFPAVTLLSFDEPMTVPALRAAGIFAARAPYVAVIEDHCNVDRRLGRARSWPRTAPGMPSSAARSATSSTDRARDWAAFLCEYSAFLEPAAAGSTDDLPGMNVSYDRRALAAIDDLLREGAGSSGCMHACASGASSSGPTRAVIDHAKDFGFREFTSQRYHYSRSYAGMRNPDLGPRRVALRARSAAPCAADHVPRGAQRLARGAAPAGASCARRR